MQITYSFTDNNFQGSDTVSPSYQAHRLQSLFNWRQGSHGWITGLYFEARHYSFDISEDDTREDLKTTLYLAYNYHFSGQWAWTLDTTFVDNQSNFEQNNIDDKNYRQIAASSRLRFQF